MGAQLRVYRRRIRSVQSTKKITRAMELIAASRIVKAQHRVAASKPYAEELTRVIREAASRTAALSHPLVTERQEARRAGVLVVTSDRGLAGAYNANALRATEELIAKLATRGLEPAVYAIGRKGVGYFRFRGRELAGTYTGFSEQPDYPSAKRAADEMIEAFVAGSDGGGVDELYLVYTEFASMLSQRPVTARVLPLSVEDEPRPEGPSPQYEFEPEPAAVLDALLPRYVEARVYAALLDSAASESASRRRAMKAATDNAEELIRAYTRAANSARQAEITQEISEIVGGADALAQAEAE